MGDRTGYHIIDGSRKSLVQMLRREPTASVLSTINTSRLSPLDGILGCGGRWGQDDLCLRYPSLRLQIIAIVVDDSLRSNFATRLST